MAVDVSAPGVEPWRGVILAGGRARRLGGREKWQLRLDGLTVLERQLAAFHAVGVPVALVVDRPGRVPNPPCPIIVDRWHGTGPLGGLATALAEPGAARVIALACDLPFITPPFLALLMASLDDHDAAVPRDGDRWHPLAAAYATSAGRVFTEALERGDRAIWRTLAALDVVALDGGALGAVDPDGRLLLNFNTPADLEALGGLSPEL